MPLPPTPQNMKKIKRKLLLYIVALGSTFPIHELWGHIQMISPLIYSQLTSSTGGPDL
jgi:hypothetical protein